MTDFLSNSGFMPHGHCYLWRPELVGTMFVSDLSIGLSYVVISVALLYLIWRIKLPFHRMFAAFGLFIAACGAGHFADVVTIWWPVYWMTAAIRAVTAMASVATALAVIRLIPKVVATSEDLSHSESRRELLDLIIAQAQEYAFFMLDPQGKILSWNVGAERMTGYREEEILGKSHETFYRPADVVAGSPAHALKHATEHGHSAGEGWRVRKDGTFFYAQFQLITLRDANGNIRGFAKITQDVTEKKKTEDELRSAYEGMELRVRERTRQLEASRREYQELVNTVDGIVWEADVGRPGYTFISRQVERILGYSMERWLNEAGFWKAILHPEDLGRLTGERYRTPAEKKDSQTEYRVITADGRTLWMKDYIRVIHEAGIPVKMRGIMVDITEQKAAANVKTEFLANMSHEIRTPLNAIIGMASVGLDEEKMSEDQRECLTTIKTAADSLLSLINDILDYSKFEAEKVELEVSDFNLLSLAQNAMDVISLMAKSKSISMDLKTEPDLPTDVRGDSGRLLQVFLNLLGNAVKFTPENGNISLKIHVSDRATDRIRFEVVDTGVGIHQDVISKLFTPFTQADNSTSRKYGGTGLGLSICKRLVNLMKGEIGVTSEEGKGASFWFEIPLAKSKEPVLNTESETESSKTPAPRQHLRILVAEDNPANRKVVLRLLEKLGHNAEVVGNGKEVLATFGVGQFDLILMDCQMPEMDGYEATRRIRLLKRDDAKGIPIVALTAHALSGEKEKCMEAGMNDYLSKPVSLKQLEGAIMKWVKDKKSSAVGASVIDRRHLNELDELQAPGRPDLLIELMECFEKAGNDKIKAISSALQDQDYECIRKSAHYFKSTCHNVGARKLAAICEQIEEHASPRREVKSVQELKTLSTELQAQYQVADAELREILKDRPRNYSATG